jgi:hypothetical protein
MKRFMFMLVAVVALAIPAASMADTNYLPPVGGGGNTCRTVQVQHDYDNGLFAGYHHVINVSWCAYPAKGTVVSSSFNWSYCSSYGGIQCQSPSGITSASPVVWVSLTSPGRTTLRCSERLPG